MDEKIQSKDVQDSVFFDEKNDLGKDNNTYDNQTNSVDINSNPSMINQDGMASINADPTINNEEQMDVNVDVARLSEAEDERILEKIQEFEKLHMGETPDEWGRSFSYFISPILFLICSITFLYIQRPNLYIIIIILVMNMLWTIYNVLSWVNQRIYIYSNRIEYHYGAWNERIKEFWFGTEDIVAAKAGVKLNLMQKKLDYASFYIINSNKLAFELKRIANPDGLLAVITNKAFEFNRFFSPDYEMPLKEIVTKKGVFVEDEDGNLILKSEYQKRKTGNVIEKSGQN